MTLSTIVAGRPRRRCATLLLLGAAVALSGACQQRAAPSQAELTFARAQSSMRADAAIAGARVVALASPSALALTDDQVVFGDVSKNGVFAAPKLGGETVFVGDKAPLDVAAVGPLVAWIATPGDAVYRARIGEPADVLLARGEFTAVAIRGADVIAADVEDGERALVRVEGPDSSRIVGFRRPARALVADATRVYALTDEELQAVDPESGAYRVLARGKDLRGLASDGAFLVTTSLGPSGRALIRAPKGGAPTEVLVRDVHRGPIATWGNHVYFFEPGGAALWHVPIAGGAPELVARSPVLASTVALAVDATGIYVALDRPDAGVILALRHPA